MLIILAFLRPIRLAFAKVVNAEVLKNAALGETIFGIKTVKSLALEPQRKALWDERTAEVGKWRFAMSRPFQLAADLGHSDRAVHVDGRNPGRRLPRLDGRVPFHGWQPVRVHDAVQRVSSPASRPRQVDRGLGRSRRRDGSGGRGAQPATRGCGGNGGLRPKFAGGVEFRRCHIHLRRNQASSTGPN